MILDKLKLSILEEFLRDYSIQLTGSEIAKKKNLNQKSVSNTLNELESINILKSKLQGRNKLFNLNLKNKNQVTTFLSAIEHMKTFEFFKNHPKISEISSKILKHSKGIVAIFGSYAKHTEKKDSDLDLLVIGKANRKEIEKTGLLYNLEINIIEYPKIKSDHLITEVIKNHIILNNAQEFITQSLEVKHGQN